jgi:uncharacterized protein (TIGR03435 family)
MRCAVAIAILTMGAGSLGAQQFDVASVRPSAVPGYIRVAPGGQRYLAFRSPLRFMILVAYQLHRDQLVIRDPWINTDLYDIDARVEGHPSCVEFRKMLQNLLADRFQLRLEREMKDGPVYALVVDRGGPKMRHHDPGNAGDPWIENKADPEPARELKMDWHATSAPMEYVAWRLTQTLDRLERQRGPVEGLWWRMRSGRPGIEWGRRQATLSTAAGLAMA